MDAGVCIDADENSNSNANVDCGCGRTSVKHIYDDRLVARLECVLITCTRGLFFERNARRRRLARGKQRANQIEEPVEAPEAARDAHHREAPNGRQELIPREFGSEGLHFLRLSRLILGSCSKRREIKASVRVQ